LGTGCTGTWVKNNTSKAGGQETPPPGSQAEQRLETFGVGGGFHLEYTLPVPGIANLWVGPIAGYLPGNLIWQGKGDRDLKGITALAKPYVLHELKELPVGMGPIDHALERELELAQADLQVAQTGYDLAKLRALPLPEDALKIARRRAEMAQAAVN